MRFSPEIIIPQIARTMQVLFNVWRWGERSYPHGRDSKIPIWRYYLRAWLDAPWHRLSPLGARFVVLSCRDKSWIAHIVKAEARATFAKSVIAGALVGLYLSL